ncbi:hypothetical protein ABZX77_51020 [Streptomyces sp. NPDC004237]|uniref:hypothetical protein n=1 Tax=Streptomyces sp. NPDC004237 TaxID=3154455 RepID=UPI0033B5FE4E
MTASGPNRLCVSRKALCRIIRSTGRASRVRPTDLSSRAGRSPEEIIAASASASITGPAGARREARARLRTSGRRPKSFSWLRCGRGLLPGAEPVVHGPVDGLQVQGRGSVGHALPRARGAPNPATPPPGYVLQD